MNSLSFNGAVIRDRDEFLSLTDMWSAAGSPREKDPARWRTLLSTVEFVDYICSEKNTPISEVLSVQRGRNGGTWAHWQIGLAYAKYLSPAFHKWCNETVRARMQGVRPSRDVDEMARLREQMQVLSERVRDLIVAAGPRLVVTAEYMSVRQAMDRAKADHKGRRSLQGRLFRRLMDRAALDGVALRRDPHSPTQVWLFPTDFMNAGMAEFGNALVAEHNDAIGRQGVLPFKKPVVVQAQPEAGA